MMAVMDFECALSIVVPTIKGKGDIRNSSCYGAVKLLEHRRKVGKGVLEKKAVK